MNTDFSQPFNPRSLRPVRQGGYAVPALRRERDAMVLWHRLSVILGFCLYTYEKETLFRIQELNLFLPDSTFYHTLAAYPGGTLQWAAVSSRSFFITRLSEQPSHSRLGLHLLLSCARPSGFPLHGVSFPSWYRLPCWPAS